MTTTRRILVWAGPLLALVVLAVAALLWWRDVADAREAYEAKLASLRAAGEPVTRDDLARPMPPEEENAATILAEVDAAYETAFLHTNGPFSHLMELQIDGSGFTPAMRADLEAWTPTIESLLERIRAASTRPIMAFPVPDVWWAEYRDSPSVSLAHALLSMWPLYRPEAGPEAAETLLALSAAYDARCVGDILSRRVMVRDALEILARETVAGRDVGPDRRGRMERALIRIEEAVLPDRATLLRDQRTQVVAFVELVVNGQSPGSTAVNEVAFATAGRLHLRGGLYRDALAILQQMDQEIAEASNLDRLLSTPLQPRAGGDTGLLVDFGTEGRLRIHLALDAAVARLGRWLPVLGERRAAGESLPAVPEAYVDDFAHGLPLDPCTGRPFPMRTTPEGGLWIGIDRSGAPQAVRDAVSPDDLLFSHLAWLIPPR